VAFSLASLTSDYRYTNDNDFGASGFPDGAGVIGSVMEEDVVNASKDE
jgi:hypothetical protein